MLEEILINNWLSKKQAKVYLASLELGSAPVARIARKSGINRTSCYDVIEEMITKGFINKSQRMWVDHYLVIDPQLLIDHHQEKFISLQQSLPFLSWLMNGLWIKPRFSLYEWVEWVKSWYADLLSSTTPIYSLIWSIINDNRINDYIQDTFLDQRIALWISQIIISSWPTYTKILPEQLMEKHQIDIPYLEITCWIHLYWPNKIMCTMLNQNEMFLFIIHSKQLYETLFSIMQLLLNKKLS
jgi:hypothetical protein